MKRKTKDEFELQLSIEKPNIKLIGLYNGTGVQTDFQCLRCNNIWKTKPKNLIYGRSVVGCPECGKNNMVKNLLSNSEEFRQKVNLQNSKIELIGEYSGTKSHVEAKCKKCGHLWKPRADLLLKGSGCPKCAAKERAKRLILPHGVFAKRCFDAGVDVTFLGEYTGQNNKILVKCNKCGNNYYAHQNSLSQGHGCALCKESIGESRVRCFLEYYSIEFDTQHRFDECKNILSLPFDFYLPDYNICIEYDGRQHFEPVDFFGGEPSFIKQQKNDLIKTNFCKDNNIQLVRIPYYKSNEIEDILFDELNIIEYLIDTSPLDYSFEDDFY